MYGVVGRFIVLFMFTPSLIVASQLKMHHKNLYYLPFKIEEMKVDVLLSPGRISEMMYAPPGGLQTVSDPGAWLGSVL
ncbi:hypothetical protein Leryth_021010 [Lithospermum erythrorhizon]|nr:hypothetical protein Leryth_021010 [Lithospermum erythrorhizon]